MLSTELTVNVAGAVATAAPALLLKTALYRLPVIAVVALEIVRVLVVTPL